MKFREIQQLITVLYDGGEVSDEEFLLLYEAYSSKNLDLPYKEYGRFQLEEMDVDECIDKFRVRKNDIPLLLEILQIPEFIKCPQGSTFNGLEGLCLLLRRLAYPCRLSDLIPMFGRSPPELSMINNEMINILFELHGQRLTTWNQFLLNPHNLQRYADAVADKGAALRNCFGFIDGTVRPICRPDKKQRVMYNGHKRVHAIKFQSLSLPNGLIANLYGPVEGRRHDSGILADSGLLNDLEQHAFSPDGNPMCIYGDPAYPLRIHLQCPFRMVVPNQDMQDFNASMSSVRVSVEWLFGDIAANSFKFVDLKKNLKIALSCVGKMYIVAAILRNAITCLYGNSTSEFFNLNPPSLQEYFA